jgi:hypothetical protein
MVSMAAFTDELLKLAAVEQAAPLIKRLVKPAALLAAGGAAVHFGGKELDKYRLGRQVYEQMQARQGE